MIANCCCETEVKYFRYCSASRLELMLFNNWMTVERVSDEPTRLPDESGLLSWSVTLELGEMAFRLFSRCLTIVPRTLIALPTAVRVVKVLNLPLSPFKCFDDSLAVTSWNLVWYINFKFVAGSWSMGHRFRAHLKAWSAPVRFLPMLDEEYKTLLLSFRTATL